MNTTPTPESSSGGSLANLAEVGVPDEPSPKDEALAALGKELDAEKDNRVEERFLWILLTVILVDVIWFGNSPNPAFPVVILILQVIGLFILARRMGVDEAQGLLERVLHGIGQRGSN
ncbi:MAG: hypothetical protein JO256_15760 [Alphaproteobacteria bacterium]|nr:hypothetical protein [Alphaproteobacteria bacterium]